MAKTALTISGVVFALVAIVHVWRVLFAVEVSVNGYVLPLWTSFLGGIFAVVLSVWMLRLAR